MLKPSSALLVIVIALLNPGFAQLGSNIHQPTLTPQNSGTTQGLIAISPVNSQVVWATPAGWHVCCYH